ncbi:MAG: AmmeMemoRadiSam system radical SAM enzyme, partial [Deltaproteobacteria bacterium]|nr:AmmeMemoRadiSam system radical SAM enzyme [Deltaproteobacteria bacterium]
KGAIGRKLSPYFTALDDQTIRCELCPHHCEIEKGKRGLCKVRENIDGKCYSLVYGNPCAINIDPVEKKPFYHVLPGTRSFSLATAGCNFVCKFCQNWEVSQARPEETYNYMMTPEQITNQALRYECPSVAFTYVEPVVFTEYMLAIGRISRAAPLLTVMHSNGFINARPLNDLCEFLDAACIDLKGFTETFYRDMTAGSLQPVLDTLRCLRTRGVHTEIVNLIIPGKNDNMEQLGAMCRWVREMLGPDVPLHFSRFYPRYKLKSIPPTPVSTLEQACRVATEEGLNFVYIGNVAEHPAGHTYCPKCAKMLIKRVGYNVQLLGLKDGSCLYCGHSIPGIWRLPIS